MKPQLAATVLLVPLLVVACDPPAAVTTRSPNPQFDFMNGPADSPLGGVHALRRCGGALTPEPQPVQTVGEMQDVLRQLRLLRDVNIHIYSPVPSPFRNFMDLCQLSPYAQGSGNLTSTDNDRTVTGNGADAFGFRAQGIVDLVSGGSARVLAESERLIAPDGTVTEILVKNVRLIPQ